MSHWSKLQKLTAAVIGASTGVGVYFYLNSSTKPSTIAFNSWTTNNTVRSEAKWDSNWDHREPASIVKPLKNKEDATEAEINNYNEKLEAATPKAVRHLILIRHGQYHVKGQNDQQRFLTDIGRQQAEFTGERLKALDIDWDKMIKSTMQRAQETGKIISGKIETIPAIEHCSLIEEGAPIVPEPPIGHWRPEPSQFFQDGARIEAGFRKHFHRAEPSQLKDSYTLIVCHANVIRYFVCRALQFPPEGWLRISLNHASITWISILPSGRIILRTLGDSGHMPPKFITNR